MPRKRELVGGEHPADHVDRFVGALVARLEVGPEREELGFEIPGRDAEGEPPAREHVEAERRLRGEQRVAVRQHEDVRLQS